MSIQDRDWYRKEMADRMRQSNPRIDPTSFTRASRPAIKRRNIAAVIIPVVAIFALYPFAARLLRYSASHRIPATQIPNPAFVPTAPPTPPAVMQTMPGTAATPITTPTSPEQSAHCIQQAEDVMRSGAPPQALGQDWLRQCKTYVADLPPDVRLWTLRDPADF